MSVIKFHHDRAAILPDSPMTNLFGTPLLTTTVMLLASNVFMTFAW